MKSDVAPAAKNPPLNANSTADKAIEILLLFSTDKPVWSSQEISTHLQMPRSTTYRYLASLRSNALIVQDAGGGFSLGPRLLHMAQVAKAGNPIVSAANGAMRELAERFKENVVLNAREGAEIIALERIDSPHRIVLKSTRTHLLPWPATGSAKVLLAFCDPAESDGLMAMLSPVAYTGKTLTSARALAKHLSEVRQQGFAVSDEERDEGVWGASVPIKENDHCRFALSVVGPKFRIDAARRRQIIEALLKAAADIDSQLS